MSALNFKIIDLDDPDLPSNDRDIYEAMLERMLADPMELEVEASESAAPAAATSAEAAVPASKEPTLGATAERQLSPVQAGDVGGSAPSAASDAAEEVVGCGRGGRRGAHDRYGVDLGRALASDRGGGLDRG
jgi:hypothetical protein